MSTVVHMRKNERVLAAAAATAGIMTLGVAASAEAGVPQGQVRVVVQVVGEAAADALTTEVEIYDTNGVVVSDCDQFAEPAAEENDVYQQFVTGCPLEAGSDYSIGLDPLPEFYEAFVSCGTPDPNEQLTAVGNSFTIENSALTSCFVSIGSNMAVLTKDVSDPFQFDPVELAIAEDFTLEVFDGAGQPFASGTVAASPECDWLLQSEGVPCFYTDLESGDYSFGEVPIPGYVGSVSGCSVSGGPDERFLDGDNETITVVPDPFGRFFLCNIDNIYAEGEITLTKTLVNDDGGTATLDDFTLELYTDGVMIDSGICGADGTCLQGSYPVGDYVVGESGPGGYTQTVSQTVSMPAEQLPDADAQISLGVLESVTVNVVNDDTATTTTVLQTTTTAFDGGSVTLPPTGDDSSTDIALVALGFLLLGGAGVLFSRR